jgi:hypothetical protein
MQNLIQTVRRSLVSTNRMTNLCHAESSRREIFIVLLSNIIQHFVQYHVELFVYGTISMDNCRSQLSATLILNEF